MSILRWIILLRLRHCTETLYPNGFSTMDRDCGCWAVWGCFFEINVTWRMQDTFIKDIHFECVWTFSRFVMLKPIRLHTNGREDLRCGLSLPCNWLGLLSVASVDGEELKVTSPSQTPVWLQGSGNWAVKRVFPDVVSSTRCRSGRCFTLTRHCSGSSQTFLSLNQITTTTKTFTSCQVDDS